MPINPKNGLATTNQSIFLVTIVAFLMSTITLLVTFGFYTAEKSRTIISPMKTAVDYLENEIDEIHRWIQKKIDSDLNTRIEFIWFQLDLSVADFRTMLEGGDGRQQVAIPDELADELRANLKSLDAEISEYKKIVTWLLNPGLAPDVMLPENADYENAYTAILTRLDGMERPIDRFFQQDMLFFRKLMVGAVITCLLLAVLMVTIISRFMKQKTADYSALSAAHEKLRHELKERKLAEKALQQSETLFRTVFETSPDAIIITRIENSSIVDVNVGFTTYTGYERSEVIGRSVLDIELWQDMAQRKAFLDEVFAEGFVDNKEAVFHTRHLGFITCLLSTKKVDIDYEPHLLTVARDISDRKRYETRIKAANKFLIIGNRNTQMQPLLKEFVEEIKVVSGCSAIAVRTLEDGKIPYAAYDGFDGDFCSLKAPLCVHSDQGMCVRVINNQRSPHASLFTTYGSYRVNDASAFIASATADQKRLMRNTCHRFGYQTIALIPIRSGDRTLGLIHLADQKTNRLDDNKMEMLETAALQLGTAIERVQMEQRLKDSHDDLEKQVDERTEMLLQAKNKLVMEVEQRKRYEQDLLGFQQRLRTLSSRLIQTEERERRRIATEIHDRIGQTLAVVKIQLGVVKAEFDVQDLNTKIESIREMISRTIRDVRTLTFELSPPVLYELGLQAALEWLATSVRKQSGLRVDIATDGVDRELDADRRVLLYRTCSELLLNVVKHAAARHARVHMGTDSDLISVTVSDDGIGFDQMAVKDGSDPFESGFGLFSIREQLQHHGGTFKIDSAPDLGSEVTIALPLATTTNPEKREPS